MHGYLHISWMLLLNDNIALRLDVFSNLFLEVTIWVRFLVFAWYDIGIVLSLKVIFIYGLLSSYKLRTTAILVIFVLVWVLVHTCNPFTSGAWRSQTLMAVGNRSSDNLFHLTLLLAFCSYQTLWQIWNRIKCGAWVDTSHFLVSNYASFVFSVSALCQILFDLCLASQTLLAWIINRTHCIVIQSFIDHWLLHVKVGGCLDMVSIVIINLCQFMFVAGCALMTLSHLCVIQRNLSLICYLLTHFQLIVDHWFVLSMLNTHLFGVIWCFSDLNWGLSHMHLVWYVCICLPDQCLVLSHVSTVRLTVLKVVCAYCLFHR